MCCPIASRMIIRAKRQHSLRVRSALHLRRKCAMSTSNMRGSQLVPQDHRIPARDPLLPHEYTADSSRARPLRDRCTAYFQLMTCVTVYAAYWAELSAYRRTWTYTKRLRYTWSVCAVRTAAYEKMSMRDLKGLRIRKAWQCFNSLRIFEDLKYKISISKWRTCDLPIF